MFTKVKTPAEIEAMREGGKMLATVLELMRREAKAGLTPKDMSHMAANELKRMGGEPAFRGYHGYPDIICISVNHQVQHSIPDGRPFETGDVVNFDFGVRYKGLITDAGVTVGIGEVSAGAERLINGTRDALAAGLEAVRDGCRVGDISAAIQGILQKRRLGIVRDLVGHGVGHALHEDPNIPNYGRAGKGPVLKAGMTIAIEPIATLGSESIYVAGDGWTLYTRDGSWAAQFEHTVLITHEGYEILTAQ